MPCCSASRLRWSASRSSPDARATADDPAERTQEQQASIEFALDRYERVHAARHADHSVQLIGVAAHVPLRVPHIPCELGDGHAIRQRIQPGCDRLARPLRLTAIDSPMLSA